MLFSRGFPKTHRFAQARAVFAVARARCHELFGPPGCMTLWSLPAEIEEQFDAHWASWIDDVDRWAPFFDRAGKPQRIGSTLNLRGSWFS